MSDGLDEYLRDRRALIEAALARALPSPPDCPAVVAEAMRYTLLAGGKRLRPILTLVAAEAVAPPDRGGRVPDALALPAACAIEMIHTYSLIHDDLPAMDDDTMRRGRPTAHVVFGEAVAILAGDALLTEAFGLLAREPADPDPALAARRLRAIGRIAAAAGAHGMVGGQAMDLADDPLDGDGLRLMHGRKTGALLAAAAAAGAIMAGGTQPAIEAIDRYATHLGLAFQIVDDILDVEGHTEHLGKTAGKDAAAGKRTYPALYGLDASRRLARQSVEQAKAALREAGLAGWLVPIADWVVQRDV